MSGDFAVTPGQVLNVVVGTAGESNSCGGFPASGGGGGGSGSLNGECKCVVGPNDRCTKGLWDALQSPPTPPSSR